tara:strand:+ start:87 stop:710 length:624 start_codon:yes stop_codon:yes gene_type:complete
MSNLVISTELSNAIDKLVKGEIAVQKAKAQVVEIAKNQGVTFSRDGAYLEKMPTAEYKELALLLAAQYGKDVVNLMSKTESEAGNTTVAFKGSHVNGKGRNERPTHWGFWWSKTAKAMKAIEEGIYNAKTNREAIDDAPDGEAGSRNLPFSLRSLKLLGTAYKYLSTVDPIKVDENADITQALAKVIESGAALGIPAEKIRGYGDKS